MCVIFYLMWKNASAYSVTIGPSLSEQVIMQVNKVIGLDQQNMVMATKICSDHIIKINNLLYTIDRYSCAERVEATIYMPKL
jgi:hypothetical protein